MGRMSDASIRALSDLVTLQSQYNQICRDKDKWIELAEIRQSHVERLQGLVATRDAVISELRAEIASLGSEIGHV